MTRYVYSCMHVLACLYVCMCVPQPFEVFTSLSCGRVKECACADTTQHRYKSPKYLCMVAELEF